MSQRILIYSDDLMASSKLLPVIRQLSGEGMMLGALAPLQEQLAGGDVKAIIIDLNRRSSDTPAIVAAAADAPGRPAVIAFGSHVQEARLQAARDAGCTAVYTSGQMHGQTAAILTAWLS